MNNVYFFPIISKNTYSNWVLENQCNWISYKITTNFNHYKTEISSWPRVLITSKALISFITSLSPKQTVWVLSFVLHEIFGGKTLQLGIGEHCFEKRELKKFAFSWKSMTNLFIFNPLCDKPTKWPKTIKQFAGKLVGVCLSIYIYSLR